MLVGMADVRTYVCGDGSRVGNQVLAWSTLDDTWTAHTHALTRQ